MPLPDPFEQEIADGKFEDLEHKKIKQTPMSKRKIKMLKLLKQKLKTIDNKFSELKQEFDKVNNAVTEQKLQDDTINLIDNTLDEDNPFKNIDTEDIWIEDGLFDNDNGQDIKVISKEIIDVNEPFSDIIEDKIEKIL